VAKVSSTIPWLDASYIRSFTSTENATIAELVADAALIKRAAQTSDELCPCDCRREHKHRVIAYPS